MILWNTGPVLAADSRWVFGAVFAILRGIGEEKRPVDRSRCLHRVVFDLRREAPAEKNAYKRESGGKE